MNAIRTNRFVRTVIVAMTFLGWFVLSNHCALARLAQQAHACCHNGDPKPVDGSRGVECCKSLHAVMPDGVKAAHPTAPLCMVAIPAVRLAPEDQTDVFFMIACDSGPPPGAESFSELVLHRSLRSHAPPFLA